MNTTDKQFILDQITSIPNIGQLSDGYHTFDSLYHQRAILFAALVNAYPELSWKSRRHEDGSYCFNSDGKWFIVGINTPEGTYTYHYEYGKYWFVFDCKELETAPKWDGHTDKDVKRLLSLTTTNKTKPTMFITKNDKRGYDKEGGE